MSVTFATGLEAQQASTEGSLFALLGTAAYSTAIKRTGAASVRCNPASGASGQMRADVSARARYSHFGLYIASLPSVQRIIQGTQGFAGWISARLESDGKLSVYDNATLIGTSANALSTGTWYWIGVQHGSGTNVAYLQIDGSDAVTGTVAADNTVGSEYFGPGDTEASAIDIYLDDLICDNAGFLAPSKVDLALPISDNTRTGVTGGAGGTTNLWDAVNNTPPAGVASASETDTSNIEYPASTTCDYIANLETYTTLGIAAGDTILAVQAVVRHGEDIGTGTKTAQNCGALTNPTVAGGNITFGNDNGAHAAETGAWISKFGTLTTSPSVTLGTSPTIRTSRVSETRVGCIDFMGMMVAWTPVAARVPRSSPYPQLLAH